MAGRAIYDWLKFKKKIFSETTCEMKLFLGRNVPLIWPFKNCVFFCFVCRLEIQDGHQCKTKFSETHVGP